MPNIKNKNILWHLLAIAIVAVWGTTFVNTKVLYNSGLTPLEIFFLRFVIAYICIWFISPRQLFSRTWRDELIMVLLGITGGSVFLLALILFTKVIPSSTVSSGAVQTMKLTLLT